MIIKYYAIFDYRYEKIQNNAIDIEDPALCTGKVSCCI